MNGFFKPIILLLLINLALWIPWGGCGYDETRGTSQLTEATADIARSPRYITTKGRDAAALVDILGSLAPAAKSYQRGGLVSIAVKSVGCDAYFLGGLVVGCQLSLNHQAEQLLVEGDNAAELYHLLLEARLQLVPSAVGARVEARNLYCEAREGFSSSCRMEQRQGLIVRELSEAQAVELVATLQQQSVAVVSNWNSKRYWYLDNLSCHAPMLVRPWQPECSYGLYGLNMHASKSIAAILFDVLFKSDAFSEAPLCQNTYVKADALFCRQDSDADANGLFCWMLIKNSNTPSARRVSEFVIP